VYVAFHVRHSSKQLPDAHAAAQRQGMAFGLGPVSAAPRLLSAFSK
jgi:hypothetical protein